MRVLLAVIVFILTPVAGFAACADPEGEKGEQVYNATHDVMQFCNGSLWVRMDASTVEEWTDSTTFIHSGTDGVAIGTSSMNPATHKLVVGGKAQAGSWVVQGVNDSATTITKGSSASGLVSMTTDQRNSITGLPQGGIIYNSDSGRLELFNGTEWLNMAQVTETNIGAGGEYLFSLSCQDALDNGKSTGDGTYGIDLDGQGGDDPFDVYCDMTIDGGGWTLVVSNGSGSIASSNYQNTGYVDEYSGGVDLVVSKMRFLMPISEIMFYQVSTGNNYIYQASASSLLNLPQGTYSLKSGSTPLPNNPCGWSSNGSYSSTTLYHKYSNSAHRAYIFSPHANNNRNQCGLFNFAGSYNNNNYFHNGYSGEWRIYVR